MDEKVKKFSEGERVRWVLCGLLKYGSSGFPPPPNHKEPSPPTHLTLCHRTQN